MKNLLRGSHFLKDHTTSGILQKGDKNANRGNVRIWEGENKLLISGYRVSVLQDGRILKLDGGDGYTSM